MKDEILNDSAPLAIKYRAEVISLVVILATLHSTVSLNVVVASGAVASVVFP